MSYEPTNWKTGDVVTSAKLNKLENGVANAGVGGAFIVNAVDHPEGLYYQLDKTWLEIRNALLNGERVILAEIFGDRDYVNTYYSFVSIMEQGTPDSLHCEVRPQGSGRSYESNSETGYPQYNYSD